MSRLLSLVCISGIVVISSLLSSCSFIAPKKPQEPVETLHRIDSSAMVIDARYSKTYQLSGNLIARYPDFDFACVHTLSLPVSMGGKAAGIHNTFELRERNGRAVKRVVLRPSLTGEPMRFQFRSQTYHIQAGTMAGSVRISIPSHQIV